MSTIFFILLLVSDYEYDCPGVQVGANFSPRTWLVPWGCSASGSGAGCVPHMSTSAHQRARLRSTCEGEGTGKGTGVRGLWLREASHVCAKDVAAPASSSDEGSFTSSRALRLGLVYF